MRLLAYKVTVFLDLLYLWSYWNAIVTGSGPQDHEPHWHSCFFSSCFLAPLRDMGSPASLNCGSCLVCATSYKIRGEKPLKLVAATTVADWKRVTPMAWSRILDRSRHQALTSAMSVRFLFCFVIHLYSTDSQSLEYTIPIRLIRTAGVESKRVKSGLRLLIF